MSSRLNNAGHNVLSAVIFQVVNIFLKFLLRTLFIYILGKEYLGVNGVFTNILSILSLTELGLGSAIIYDMYKPIAENNYAKIDSLVSFFKRIYYSIGSIILIIGLSIIPFLDSLITDIPSSIPIRFIYLLFLANTVSSYFFAQYPSVINAFQKNYVITNINTYISVIKVAIESIVLVVFHSFIIYLLLEILIQFVQNLLIRRKALVMFPFLGQYNLSISKDEKINIFKNAFSNFSIKISGTIIEGTNNILISVLVSTILVGIYSNYSLITQILLSTSVMFMTSVTAGVGNICASESCEYKLAVFNKLNFLYFSAYALLCICFLTCIDEFICIWAGESFKLDFITEVIIIANCTLAGLRQVSEIFVSADGLFQKFKYVPLGAAVLNLSISFALGRILGIDGVLLGTTISQLATTFWYYPYVVHRISLDTSPFNYYIRFCFLLIYITIIVAFLFVLKTKVLMFDIKLLKLIMELICAMTVFFLSWFFLFNKNENFQYYSRLIISKLKK